MVPTKAMVSFTRERYFYRAPPRGVKNICVLSSCLARDVYPIESVKARIPTNACPGFQKDTCFCNSNFLYKRLFENTRVIMILIWISRKSVCLLWIFVLRRSNSFFLQPVECLWMCHCGKTVVFHTRVWWWFLRKTMFSCRPERSFYRAPPRGVKNRRVFSRCLARDV